jgi:Nucleotide modification associated domain 3
MSEATNRNPNFGKGDVLAELTQERSDRWRHSARSTVHLDPYLSRDRTTVSKGWMPAFGQDDTAQRHLENEGVGRGDLFLFFGWFRQVEVWNKQFRYRPGSPDLHVLFGWLQIGDVIRVDDSFSPRGKLRWLKDHPHVQDRHLMKQNNTIYVASDRLYLDGLKNFAGGGLFSDFDECLQLTEPNTHTRTSWLLPSWLHPSADTAPTLSYHRPKPNNPGQNRWALDGKPGNSSTRLRSVSRGQEFVIDLKGAREKAANIWLKSLFTAAKIGLAP